MNSADSPWADRRIAIVLATYNEIANLPQVIDELGRALPSAQVVIVDDNSPDGTGRWCEEQIRLGRPLVCIHRATKEGLGCAAAAGFAWAIERQMDWIGTMDADRAHDPSAFQTMLAIAARDPQLAVVIGSRYVAGGQTIGWPLHRRLASRLVNAAARFWLRLPTCDNSSAFRLYRVAALKRIGAQNLKSKGYAYLEEVLWRLRRGGFRAAEVPITFRQREIGSSKLSAAHALGAARDILLLPFLGEPSYGSRESVDS